MRLARLSNAILGTYKSSCKRTESLIIVTVLLFAIPVSAKDDGLPDQEPPKTFSCAHFLRSQSEFLADSSVAEDLLSGPTAPANDSLTTQPLPGAQYRSPILVEATDRSFAIMNSNQRLSLVPESEQIVELSCERTDSQKCFFVSDGEMAIALLKATRTLPGVDQQRSSSVVPNAVKKLIGGEVFLGDGAAWRNRRETLRSLFSVRHIENHLPAVEEALDDFANRLESISSSGEVVDWLEEMNFLTFDIFLNVYLQKRNEGDLNEAFRNFRILFRSVNEELLAGNQIHPSVARMLMRRRAVVDGVNLQLVEERRRLGFPSPEHNLIDKLAQSEDESGNPLSTELILAELRTIYVASTDTTAWLLTQGTSMLMKHPEASRLLLREQINADIHENPIHDTRAMPITNAFVKEVLRISPPFHTLSLSIESDIYLGGYLIPEGSLLLISPDSLHNDPEQWANPQEFRPTRFLERANEENPRGCHIPFGMGERICLGQSLAQVEAMVLFYILNRDFELTCRSSESCEALEHRPSFIRTTPRDEPFQVSVNTRDPEGISRTYSQLMSLPIGSGQAGNWQFEDRAEADNAVMQGLFDNVYVPMGSEKRPQFNLYLTAKNSETDEPIVVFGVVETDYGIRIDRVGHDNSRAGLRIFSDFMAVRGIEGMYMEIHGVPLVMSSRRSPMRVVPYETVQEIQQSEGVEIRRPTADEISQAITDGLLPDNEEIYSQSYIRILSENGNVRERKIRVMVGRPLEVEN